MKTKTKMGEIHRRYVWPDGSSKQSGGGQASKRALRRSIDVCDPDGRGNPRAIPPPCTMLTKDDIL